MIYAIGDIHGKFTLLKKLYNAILQDIADSGDAENIIIFEGDYIDRGRENVETLAFLMLLEDFPGVSHHYLWGNHEQIFKDALTHRYNQAYVGMWVNNGGDAFLREVGMDFDQFASQYPYDKYLNWFDRRLCYFIETDDYVFVHGGLDIRQPDMRKQDTEHLLWARHMQQDWYKTFPKIVVHGHTPRPEPVVDNNRINVDTSSSPYPRLTAVVLPNRKPDDFKPRFIVAVHTPDTSRTPLGLPK